MNKGKALAALLVFLLWTLPFSSVRAVDDGRVNEVAYLGGIAIYCNTDAGDVTNTYEDFEYLRIFNETGFEVQRFDAENLIELSGQGFAGELEEAVLVGSGSTRDGANTYTLYVAADGYFQINGNDEYGNDYEFRWLGCTPVEAPEDVSEEVPEIIITPEPCLASSLFDLDYDDDFTLLTRYTSPLDMFGTLTQGAVAQRVSLPAPDDVSTFDVGPEWACYGIPCCVGPCCIP